MLRYGYYHYLMIRLKFDNCFLQLPFDLAQTFSQYLAAIMQRLVTLSDSLPSLIPWLSSHHHLLLRPPFVSSRLPL
jgi:hypothetical protein